MGNNACPICDEKTQGKAVRDVNFCNTHRIVALSVRDDLRFEHSESRYGVVRGQSFVQVVRECIVLTNERLVQQGLIISGTEHLVKHGGVS